jgi:hypothetical protein
MESVLASHFDDLQDCNGRAALAILFDRFGHFLTNAKRLENTENIIIYLKILPQKIKCWDRQICCLEECKAYNSKESG